jgi:eukaryotic-like serine/threonine-protein kinase
VAQLEEGDLHEANRLFLPAGTVLRGKYRIDGVIGSGGMAVVYAATHRNRKRFAVKVLHSEFSTRHEVRARFVREGYVANSVEHPGVVSVLDDDVTEDGSAFLVMELLEGATVEGFAPRSRPLPLRESLAIVVDVLDVLEAAHAKGIVHRDIKPANLFVTRQGQLKVLDFGIARLRDATLGLKATGTGATLGTPAFMAPEQALALASEIDARTDLWAVGATLFTMLSGSLVHPGDNARQVMVRAATEPARSLVSVAPDLPAGVIEWVNKALEFDKTARWESAALMRDAARCMQQEYFAGAEEMCAKCLFELRAEDIAMSPTEHSPMGPLRSAVRETAQQTLDSLPGELGARHSLSATRPHAPGRSARSRRFFWAPVAAAAGVVALMLAFARPTRRLQASLSAASPSSAAGATSSLKAADGRPPAAERSSPTAPSLSSSAPAGSGTIAISPTVLYQPARSLRSAPAVNRKTVPAPAARIAPASSPAVKAAASVDPTAAVRIPPAPPRNPLQIDIQ